MNPTINAIRYRARQLCDENPPSIGSAEDAFDVKFAEMIINECCRYMCAYDYSDANSPNEAVETAAHDIKQHFGIR